VAVGVDVGYILWVWDEPSFGIFLREDFDSSATNLSEHTINFVAQALSLANEWLEL
jgi:hypothetical protein